MKKRILSIVMVAFLLLATIVPGLSCSTQSDAWTEAVYYENLYVWSGSAWVKVIGAGVGGNGTSLWEIDGTETQLISADEVDMQTYKIINVVDPVANQDAATKKYVDDEIGSDHPHQDIQTTATPQFDGLTSTGQIALDSVGANYITATNAGGDLRLGAGGGTNDLRIDTDGKTYIYEDLTVEGNVGIFDSGSDPTLNIGDSTAGGNFGFLRWVSATDTLNLGTTVGGTFNDQITLLENGNVGIGTSTIPHGGVGAGMFAIDGPNASPAGPHAQYTTATDDYPVFQQLNWEHDSIYLGFDVYYDGAFRSSDVGSNFEIYKYGNILGFRYDSGIAAGDPVTWNIGIVLDTSGYVGIGTVAPASTLHLYGAAPTMTVTSTNAASGFRINVVGLDGDNDDLLRIQDEGSTMFIVERGGEVGIGVTAPLDPLHVLSDAAGDAIHIEEFVGGEDWQIGVDASGDLNFQDSGGSTEVTFEDGTGYVGIGILDPVSELHIAGSAPIITATGYNEGSGLRINTLAPNIYLVRFQYAGDDQFRIHSVGDVTVVDGSLCVDDDDENCPVVEDRNDGWIYCDFVIEYSSYWDENTQGSALEEIMRHKGVLSPDGEMKPDYDTFMEGIKATGYIFPEYLGERFQASNKTAFEFYNSLTAKEQADVEEGCSGISLGGRISQNEQGIRELYLLSQEQQVQIDEQQTQIGSLESRIAELEKLLLVK